CNMLNFLKLNRSKMPPIFLLAVAGLFAFLQPISAQPYTSSCETAIEKLSKAQKDVDPFQRTMELARARERGAYADLAVCTGGGIYSVNKAVACNEATWKAPERTKEVIEAEDQYLQARKAFEELFEQAKRICLRDP
ncbi:MAG: hypothetical protein R3B74_14545, partial [Nitrospirales bacterium]|nr:hypothetical protein [Nitrospirales bacterium]